MKKLYIKPYGCQMNVYDGDRMGDVLRPLGYERVDSPEDADFVILNTCHIREKADEKVFSDLGRMRALQAQKAASGGRMWIAVSGCVAQAEGAEILKRAPYVDMIFGPQTYHRLPQMLAEATRASESASGGADGRAKGPGKSILMLDFPVESKFDFLPEENQSTTPGSAFLSIQEGCDKFCTYCVVPFTRGQEYARPVRSVMAEARRLVEGGAKELTLLGQNVNNYHGEAEAGGTWSLGRLLQEMTDVLGPQGLKRLRYTTSYPRDVDQDLINAHRDNPLLMPFLHLPVQSGSDKVLKEMNRKHTARFFLDLIDKFRDARPDIVFSSDFIVGFPGETDADFQDTLRLVDQVNFASAYSFKFSARPGTAAALRTDMVDEGVALARLHILQDKLNTQRLAFNASLVGQELEILLERPGTQPHQWIGRSPYMQSVHVISPDNHIGDMIPVFIEEGFTNSLRGLLRMPQRITA